MNEENEFTLGVQPNCPKLRKLANTITRSYDYMQHKHRLSLLLIFLLLSGSLFAQKGIPISVGYYGHFAYQPGVKVGTSFNLIEREKQKESRKGTKSIHKSLFVSPQIGFFTQANSHLSFPINVDVGYQRRNLERDLYSAYSLGLGYLLQYRTTSIIYNLNDGSVQKKIREQRGYFMPTLNYELGKGLSPSLDVYGKLSAGMLFAPQRESSLVTFLEIGVKYYFQTNGQD